MGTDKLKEYFGKYQYENVSTIRKYYIDNKGNLKYNEEVHVRLFDPKTKKSFFEEVTELCIPDIYLPDSKENQYVSYLDENIKLSKKTFPSLEDFKKSLKKVKKKTGKVVEITTDEGETFEIDEEIFKDEAHGYNEMRHLFIHRYFPDSLSSNHIHRTWFLDIETFSGVVTPGEFPHSKSAYERISLIQIYDNFLDQYIMIGYKPFTKKIENCKYIHIEDEAKMLEFFLSLKEKLNPSIISGFNSMLFDIPYITNRVARVLDGYKGSDEGLNKRKSYIGMENVNRLSPLGYVYGKKCTTKDEMEGITSIWEGVLLIDYKELAIKYGYLGLSSYSLDKVSKTLGFEGKVDHSSYASFQGFTTGEGYVFPDNPTDEEVNDEVYQIQLKYKKGKCSKEEMEQVVWDRFCEYGLRDVEILYEIDRDYEYLKAHQGIAYLCSVPMSDNWGTYEQWGSYFFKEALKNNEVLPLKQQYGEDNPIYLAGWTRSVPGKYYGISSFDFASLYPSVYRTWNIGTDVMLKPHEIPKELKELKEKYFNYFTQENLNRNPEVGKLGKVVEKYQGSINDITDETDFYISLIENKEEISKVLKKYNVSATPNGYFFRKNKQSMSAYLMESMFKDRYFHKGEHQKIFGEMERLDKDSEEYHLLKRKYDDHILMDSALKSMLVSFYGAGALSHNQFSSGKLTNACVTISGRMSNRYCSYKVNEKVNSILKKKTGKKSELNNIIQVDTDSLYCNLGEILELPKFKNLNKLEKTKIIMKLSSGVLQETINSAIRDISEALNTYEDDVLQMENETITEGFVSIASKRYYTKVVVKDGTILETPKLKITGLDIVGKSTPDYFKSKLKPVLDIILEEDEKSLIGYINEVRNEFLSVEPTDFCRKVSVKSLKYDWDGEKYKKPKDNKFLTAPIGSWASLEYNKFLESHDMKGKYPEIESGEKVNYVYVESPNELLIKKAIAWKDPQFTRDINLRSVVDYDEHFEKDFIKKIEIITSKIGWNARNLIEEAEVW